MIYNKRVFVTALNRDKNPAHVTQTFVEEMANYGFIPNKDLLEHIEYINPHELKSVLATLKELRGEGSNMVPMYPNFPDSVIEKDLIELYFNAILHYWAGLLPYEELCERLPFESDTEPTVIKYGGLLQDALPVVEEFVGQPIPMNPVQVEFMLAVFEITQPDHVTENYIPIRENLATYLGNILKYKVDNVIPLSPKDALRIAHVYGGGDSTGDTQKIPTMPRRVRRWLLQAMDQYVRKNSLKAEDDFALNTEPMKRLAERLHPHELAPARSITKMFNKNRIGKVCSVDSRIEENLQNDFGSALSLLVEYPGRFARMLNRLLTQFPNEADNIVSSFSTVATKADTKLLLSLREYFTNRNHISGRFFIPKSGGLTPITTELKPLPDVTIKSMLGVLEQGIIGSLPKKNELGKMYIDPLLEKVKIPSMDSRKVSKGMNILPRGSRVPAPDANIIRCFIHWKNLEDTRATSWDTRVDIDLSVKLLNEYWEFVTDVSYYNLKHDGVTHSGDIVDAPNGASEYIDIDRRKVPTNVRYIIMTIHSYTQQSFTEVPELFAGWMSRDKGMSGKVYEPKSVEHAINLTTEGQQTTVMAIDVKENEIVWIDTPGMANWINNAYFSGKENRFATQVLLGLNRTTVGDLLRMYAQAGGNDIVEEDADTVFNLESVLDGSITELLR